MASTGLQTAKDGDASTEKRRTPGTYQDLKVGQRAIELAEPCYAGTRKFPKDEIYGLTSQIRRAATSVAAHIAEGYGRESPGDFVRVLRTAQGSLKELETTSFFAAEFMLEVRKTSALWPKAVRKLEKCCVPSCDTSRQGNKRGN